MLKQAGISFISASLLIAGCGGGSSSSNNNDPTPATLSGVAVTTATATQAINQSIQLSSALSGMRDTPAPAKTSTETAANTQLYKQIANAMGLRPSRADTTSTAKVLDMSDMCSGGGSASFEYPDLPDANPYDMTISYANCVDDIETTNGSLFISETLNNDGSYTFTISMGNTTTPFSTISNSGSYAMSTTFSMTGTDNSDGSIGTVSMNGTMQESMGTDSMSSTFTNFSMGWNDGVTVMVSTMNGGMSMTETLSGVTEGFSSTFTALTLTENISDGSYTIDGTLAFSSTPSSCGDGSYTFTTLNPLFDTNGVTTAGKLSINDATIEYLSDGSVLITLADGTSQSYTQAELQQQVCRV